ncbi:hypothetical protein NDA01_11830 [Trichocoleus desertorum AS-A10]|uniref:hypothetical protein n=1 Tax=Trichocoleus desertorum TaxID=1481672 RepID=UPI0032999201
MLQPLVVIEQQSSSYFKFWYKNVMHDGMRYQSELFRHFRTFSLQRRNHAYSLGCALAQQGIQTVITCVSDRNTAPTDQRYVLWISLRSPWAESEPSLAESLTPSLVGTVA